MFSPFQLAIKYFKYYLTASNGKGHGTHSPFVFDFITNILNSKKHYYAYDAIEALRVRLKKDKAILTVEDMGAGSITKATLERSVSSIAKNAAKAPKYGQLLFRLANKYGPGTILELGTSFGISTCYLAMGNQQSNVITMEGSKAVAEKALENFNSLGIGNVKLVHGNFDNTLPKVVDAIDATSLVFVDGNHRKEPTLRYFKQLLPAMSFESVIIFDDIHWSSEMEEAWEAIKSDPAIMLTVDLFFVGLVFFSPSFKVKQHFTIRF